MSLLEDIFLQDEANEAQELERVIEGGDYEERLASNSDDDSEKEDEAEEDKRRVDPTSTKTRRVVKNPRFILNPARLTGPRGIQVIPEHFKDFKFKGKGHEKEDLDLVLKKLEHWAYRLYPKFKFEDCLKKIETLGKKRPVMVHLQKIRSDQLLSEETVVQKDSSDEETQPEPDEFDKLLQQQIELARATPAPVNRTIDTSVENRSMAMPKATSSPSISEEQRERMLQNRRLAEERRLSKLNNFKNNASISNITNKPDTNTSKQDQTDDIDSSDEENASEVIRIEVQTHRPDEPEQNKNVTENQSLQTKQKSNSFNSSDDTSNDDEFQALSDEYIKPQTKKCETNIIDSSEDESNVIKDKIELGDDANNSKISLENDARKITESNEEINNDLSDIECSFKQKESSETNANNRINVRDIVLENSIIQSTIQGLVENENNINLERDLINQANINTQSVGESEELMEVDFSEEF